MYKTNSYNSTEYRMSAARGIFILALFFLFSVSAKAQNNISITVKGQPMAAVLEQLKEKSGLRILYNGRTIKDCRPVTVKLRNVTIEQALNEIFTGQPVKYTITRGVIVVSSKAEGNSVTETVGGPAAAAPTISISGTVSGVDNRPLPGASITEQLTGAVTVTADNGAFMAMNVPIDGQLIFSFIGYESDTIAVNANQIYAVRLKPAANKMEEVFVSTGYQKLSRERATGSFAKPDMKVFEERTGSMDVISRLDGLVPGLTVVSGTSGVVNTGGGANSSRYGNGNTTQKSLVRGQSSVALSTDPLYVVNGLPVVDFNTINPNDIADISVLKDAAATAIWGARAANGVIVVTTKSGNRGSKLKVSYNGFVNFMGKPDQGYSNVMNSSQYITVAKQLFNPVQFPYATLGTSYVAPHDQIMYDGYRGKLTADQVTKALDSLAGLDNRSQIRDLFFRNAYTANHTLSVSGGSANYAFYGSLAYTDIHAFGVGQSDKTYRITLNQDMTITKWLKASLFTSLNNTVRKSVNLPDFSNNSFIPYQLFQDEQGRSLKMNFVQGLTPETRADYQARSRINLDYDPVSERNDGFSRTNNIAANITGDITIQLMKGLSFQGTYGFQKAPGTTYDYMDHDAYRVRRQALDFTVAPSAASVPVYYLPLTGGTYTQTYNEQRSWTVRNQLIYNTRLRNNKDRLSLQAGHEARETFMYGTNMITRGYNYDLQTSPYIDYGVLSKGIIGAVSSFRSVLSDQTMTRHEETSRYESYFALAGYTYNDKYNLDVSWRVDHSNLFGASTSAQNKPVYSIGGKWNMSRESFLQPAKWIDNLALRVTYGITGNSPYTGSAAIDDILVVEFPMNPAVAGTGVRVNLPSNPLLSWESTKTYNAGLDFAAVKSRISGSLDFYYKNTTDLLGSMPANILTGYYKINGNIGQLVNKGFEAMVKSVNVRERLFEWNTTLTFSYNNNRLVSYQGASPAPTTAAEKVSAFYLKGLRMSPLFAYRYAGLDNAGNPQIIKADGSKTSGPNAAQVDDVVYAGTTVPVFNGGFSNNFRFRRFSLTCNMVYNLGHVMRKDINSFYTGRIMGNPGTFTGNLHPDLLKRWQKAGDELTTDIPGYVASENPFVSTRNLDYYRYANTNVVSASYIKLRDVTLSWQFPRQLLDKAGIASASVYVQAGNFMVWRKNSLNIDPEYHDLSSGIRFIPPYKHTYSVGLNVNF
ncbi:TonB-linked SusC/RagA family outer membrane protein [Filimonas zeae]|uniref:SusC/RagA family TonB-linked outer membrane protein n=1 Tax=Filimonas zeae TaxID=1737353 RepID=A0A917IVR6_9BACT|nr:SusC/RagA family TonB-linked outer membrane protein [Filimonas zeae]MDR6339220.1 TonB-linked SusC/RagA family outer membrane protein [Filimonas zeae]GGH64564.1 SusC/RagA family TonB-linked outer membrane protein [Filimonas zeae]